jgi:3-hydroxyacyl-[acyl-carrier-protein] dehydratase
MFLKDDKGDIITLLHNDIIKLIPHRYPFLLIDKVTDIVINESITGIKSVTFNEPFFPGHFPGHPVMPGVLILESMAQSAACLVSYQDKSLSSNNLVFFTGVEKAKFRKPVTPGNELILKINLISTKRSFYKFNGEAFVQDELVASADFSAMLVNEEKAK